jgi:hypothetical protein
MDAPIRLPFLKGVPNAEGWTEEELRYRVTPHPRPKFHAVIDIKSVFTEALANVRTRVRPPVEGQVSLQLDVRMELGKVSFEDRYDAPWRGGVVSGRLLRKHGEGRKKEIDFQQSPFPLPPATYPEVLLPFLLRGQPWDGQRRILYSWTSDRFVARVYYENREQVVIDTPAGRIATVLVWMYPDLNDWVSLGSMLTRLAKPLLPRYQMWFEVAPPHRLARFEGSYGPPGAPEIVIELLG